MQINDITIIVGQVKNTLEGQPMKYSVGLENVLQDIKQSCLRVTAFFNDLDRYASYKGALYLLKHLQHYFDIQNQFKDFNRVLPSQHSRLNNFLLAGNFEVAGEMKVDIERESTNQRTDFQSLIARVEKIGMNVETAVRRKDTLQRNSLSIRPDEISKEVALCKGSYGNYSTACLDKEKVMILRMWDDADHNMKNDFTREKRNLMFFSDGSIVRVIGYCDEPDVKFLVLEYMEQGKLSDVLHKSGKTLSLETKLKLAKTAAFALYRLHQKLVHTSLRTDMYLVDEHYTAKLSGLQYAKTFTSARRFVAENHPVVDVNRYIAPERFMPVKPTKAADIYGFGIVLWEIFTQTKPFSTLEKEIGQEPTFEQIRKFLQVDKGEEFQVGDQNDPVMAEVSEIIRKCRAIEPQQRSDAGDIYDKLNKMYEDMKYKEFQEDQ